MLRAFPTVSPWRQHIATDPVEANSALADRCSANVERRSAGSVSDNDDLIRGGEAETMITRHQTGPGTPATSLDL